MANIRALRAISVASLFPGFGLLIASGVVCRNIFPAIGLVPLFFSAAFNFLLLSTSSGQGSQTHSPTRSPARSDGGGEPHLRPGLEEQATSPGFWERHPILVFLLDVIFSASLMTVLVFTWIITRRLDGPSGMLAGYATMTLLLNFLIHAWLATREFIVGIGLSSLFNHVRYRGVPADCPGCGTNIRPATPPTPPWFRSVSVPKLSYRQINFSVPAAVPAILDQARSVGRDWKAPAWASGGAAPESESLIANQEGGETSHEAYRDDYDEDAVGVRPSVDLPAAEQAGGSALEEVVSKSDKKGKSADEELFP